MRRRSFLWSVLGALTGKASPAPGTTLAYVQSDGLWIRALPDGIPSRLVSAAKIGTPRFSPSANWISYLRGDRLHVVSSDGSRDAALPKGPSQWAPTGDQLLVESRSGLNIFAAADGWHAAQRKIPGASLPVAFHPDGREFVYGDAFSTGRGPGGEEMRTGQLRRAAFDGPNPEPEVLSPQYLSGRIPYAWTRDGRYILFWDDPDFSGSAIADGLELFRISAGGGSPESLGVSTFLHIDRLAFHPAGDRLAVSTGGGREDWEGKRIAMIDLRTLAKSYVTEPGVVAVSPSWSPDGTTIAYSAAPAPPPGPNIGGGEEARQLLARRRIFVTNRKQPLIDDDRYRDEEPLWSADGKHILFCRMAADNTKSLWRMDADGSGAIQLAGPLYIDPGPMGEDDSWFGYYGYIAWRDTFDLSPAPR